MFIAEGVPYRPAAESDYTHPVFGTVKSMWFRLSHPELPFVKEGEYEDVFEAVNDQIAAVKAAMKDGGVVRLKVNPVASISKAGKAWVKMQVVEVVK